MAISNCKIISIGFKLNETGLIQFWKRNQVNENYEETCDHSISLNMVVYELIYHENCNSFHFYIKRDRTNEKIGKIGTIKLNSFEIKYIMNTSWYFSILGKNKKYILNYFKNKKNSTIQFIRQNCQKIKILNEIQILFRCRPLLLHEINQGYKSIIGCINNDVYINPIHTYQKPRKYSFHKSYGPESTQNDIYQNSILPIVYHALEGYKCTIFAYGQTGSGKTYSMEGTNKNPGIIQRSLDTIFKEMKRREKKNIKISHVEIYNEELTDLFSNQFHLKLKIIKNPEKNGIIIQGLNEIQIENYFDGIKLLEKSLQNRQKAETLCNKESSRSHSIFTIHLQHTEIKNGQEIISSGHLRLVDLSGSENYEKAGAIRERQIEATNISQSLLALGRVIHALVEKSSHVPYRESKLTRLLQDSLDGSSLTTILLAVSPGDNAVDETLSTLNYANMAKRVTTCPEKEIKIGGKSVESKLDEIIDIKPVKEPWEGHIPIKKKSGNLIRLNNRILHLPSEEWSINISNEKKKLNEIIRNIFQQYDIKKTGYLTKQNTLKLNEKIFQKKNSLNYLTENEFQILFQKLIKNDPWQASQIFLLHGYTMNMEKITNFYTLQQENFQNKNILLKDNSIKNEKPSVGSFHGIRKLKQEKNYSERPSSAPMKRLFTTGARPLSATSNPTR